MRSALPMRVCVPCHDNGLGSGVAKAAKTHRPGRAGKGRGLGDRESASTKCILVSTAPCQFGVLCRDLVTSVLVYEPGMCAYIICSLLLSACDLQSLECTRRLPSNWSHATARSVLKPQKAKGIQHLMPSFRLCPIPAPLFVPFEGSRGVLWNLERA